LTEKANLIEALRDQQFQLRRLMVKHLWATETSSAMLDEIENQIVATKAALAQLEQLISHHKARSKE